MEVLMNEMTTKASTYICLSDHLSSLTKNHYDFCNSLNITPPCDKLPYTYWTPKFHKPTLSQRFIVSYVDCTIGPIAKQLSVALSVVQNQIESFCRMLKQWTGIHHCWMIDNSTAIVNHLKNVNNRSAGRNITTHDFTTLYTMLPHNDILDSMNNVIDLAFKKSKNKFISVY